MFLRKLPKKRRVSTNTIRKEEHLSELGACILEVISSPSTVLASPCLSLTRCWLSMADSQTQEQGLQLSAVVHTCHPFLWHKIKRTPGCPGLPCREGFPRSLKAGKVGTGEMAQRGKCLLWKYILGDKYVFRKETESMPHTNPEGGVHQTLSEPEADSQDPCKIWASCMCLSS